MASKNGTATCSNGDGATPNKLFAGDVKESNKPLTPQSNLKNVLEGRSTNFTDEWWTLVSLITFLADVLTDILVCVQYFRNNNIWWFGLSASFLGAASLAMQLFSLKWLWDDGKREACFTYLLHFFQLGPLWRYWKVLKKGWKARKRNASILDFVTFLGEWRDISMLRLLQAFVQSAPQLVLQLYILLQRYPFDLKTDWLIVATAGTSLLSMIWAILAYSKSLRDFRKQGYRISLPGLFLQLLWRIAMVTSRVVAMVLFASYFQNWLFLAVGLHWLIMTTWLICQRPLFCTDEDGKEHPCREKLFCAMIGFMYIFCFFNAREGVTRKRVILYYSVILVENSLFVAMWYPHKTFRGVMAFSALGVVWGGMVFGALCMAFYYRFYHPSSPVQGIILRKMAFDLEGQTTQTWVCCFCCPVKKSKQDAVEVQGFIRSIDVCGQHQIEPAMELDIIARGASQEILRQTPGDHVQRTWPRDCISAPDSSVLVHSTPRRPFGTPCSHVSHPLISSQVPKITVTGPSPEVMSPFSNVSLVTLKDADIDTLDQVLQRSENPQANSAGMAEDSYIDDYTQDILTQGTDPTKNYGQAKEKSSVRTSSTLQNSVDPKITSPKSPTSREIISWFHPDQHAYGEGSLDDIEDKAEKINYGSLSFGHRYSLVSSDCISLSTESSQSSLDSIVFADEGPGCSGACIRKSYSRELTPRAADEGIFSDERDSPLKGGNVSGASDEPDANSAESTPQKTRVNAQFPVSFGEGKGDSLTSEYLGDTTEYPKISPSKAGDYAFVELLMDAALSPSSTLNQRRRDMESSVSSEEQMELEREEKRLVRLGSGSGGEDGHESESTDVSSESNHFRKRHRSYDEIEDEKSEFASTPEAKDTNKRHTFDFSQLSNVPRSPGRRKRERRYRRSKRREFDNFVVTTLRPGKYGSLRRSIDRMAKIQEDVEESFLINTEVALNTCIPEDKCASSPIPDALTKELILKTKTDVPMRQDLKPWGGSSTGEFQPEVNNSGSERENFIKKKRLKRFLSKELAPGRFSSVRLSSDENFQGKQPGGRPHVSVDSLPSRHHSHSDRRGVVGTASLPDVVYSHNRQKPGKTIESYKRNYRNANHRRIAMDEARYHGNKDLGFVPKKRHTYDFTHSPVNYFETKEWLFGKDGERRSAADHQQRKCQSEVMIAKNGFGVFV